MTRSHILQALYGLTATALTTCTILSALLLGPAPTIPIAAGAALLLTAFNREHECAAHHHTHPAPTTQPPASAVQALTDDDAQDLARTELNAACCDHWWTSLGEDHHPNCRNWRARR